MASNTTRDNSTGGDVLRSDSVDAGKIQVAKIATGRAGVEAGLASQAYPVHFASADELALLSSATSKLGEMRRLLDARRVTRIGRAAGVPIPPNGGDAGLLDISTLSFTGWWEASYGGSPWLPTASAGTSGANGNLVTSVNAPAVGAALNGFTPADDDVWATGKGLGNSNALSTFLSASGWSYSGLIYVRAFHSNVANSWENDPLAMDTQQFWGTFIKGLNGSGTGSVLAYNWDGADKSVTATISTGVWTQVQAYYDGASSTLGIRTNSNAWTTTAAVGNLTSLTGTLQVMNTASNLRAFDGQIANTKLANVVFDAATFDAIKAWDNARYGLAN